MRKLLITIILSVVWITDIFAQDAVYVYRNDGVFDAFLTEDVDSIVFMTVPVDSMGMPEFPTYPDSTANFARRATRAGEVAVQAVYTPDEVHYIPMDAVDSISFVAPPTIFADNVVRMEQNVWKHITKVDGMTLHFAKDLPQELIPQKNNILLCTDIDCPLFNEGFVGRVTKVTGNATSGYVVNCESVTNIDEIFKQLIAVERITADSGAKNVRRRSIDGSWESDKIHINIERNFEENIKDVQVWAGAKINGNILGTVVYNFSKNTKYVKLQLKHDWQMETHMGALISRGYEYVTENGKDIFTTYFPWWCPVFKFSVAEHAFIHANGEAVVRGTIKSPKYDYTTSIIYNNGDFTAENKEEKYKDEDDKKVKTFTAFDLSGNLHIGGMTRVSIGTIDCIDAYIKAVAELYVGPQLSCNYRFDDQLAETPDYYQDIKNSKISANLLAFDLKAYGHAQLSEDKVYEKEFFNSQIGTLLTKDWYYFPHFPVIQLEQTHNSATVSCKPLKDLVAPLQLGYILRDNDYNILEKKYNEEPYQDSDKDFTLTETFENLKSETQYYIYPLIKFRDKDVQAMPMRVFTTYEDPKPLCPDDHHPHMIDLGLPSGKKWACCNVGAEKPEDYGGYYAWAEIMEKATYTWENHLYYTPPVYDPSKPPTKDPYRSDIQHDIEGTQYDVAHTSWGDGWRMPTKAEYDELKDNCTWEWTTNNGTNGIKMTGPSGYSIFLPAAGYSRTAYIGEIGYYRYGTYVDYQYNGVGIYKFSSNGHLKGLGSAAEGLSIRAIKE